MLPFTAQRTCSTKIADGLEIFLPCCQGAVMAMCSSTRNNFETKDGFVIGTGSLKAKAFCGENLSECKIQGYKGQC